MLDRLQLYGHTRIAVAVSGGADSVFLLHALHSRNAASAILHVNHHLRGPESGRDEAFVRALAARFNLPIYVLDAPPLAGNIEQEARRARYDFFAAHLAAGLSGAVATGHTLDDQAETVLLRVLRGAGTAGLSGIRPVTRSGIVRPLLSLRRDEIRAWLAAREIPWREDLSNQNPEFQRNRMRLQHLPELAASYNPALPEVLASTAAWALAEEDYWTAELDRLAPLYLLEQPETVLISTHPFIGLPVALQRRLLRRAIERVRGGLRGIDFRHVEGIRAMMATREGSGRVQLPDLDIYRSFDWLRLTPVGIDSRLPRDFEIPLTIPGRADVPERRLSIEMELVNTQPVYNGEVQMLDWDKCSGSSSSRSLRLRNWRPGDQYQPQGRSTVVKIKTLFQEHRVPLWERRTWPVIVKVAAAQSSDVIVWSRRFGIAAEYAAAEYAAAEYAAAEYAAEPGARKFLLIREAMESNPPFSASMLLKRARNNQLRSGEPGAEVL